MLLKSDEMDLSISMTMGTEVSWPFEKPNIYDTHDAVFLLHKLE